MNRAFVSTAAVALTGLALSACVASASRAADGRTFYESGNYLAATDAFTEDIRLHPRSADAWNNRGITRVRLGDLNGAVLDYNHALDLAPMDAEIYFNRGNALVAAGHYAEAIADYDQAARLVPSYARAIFNRGTAYALANQPDAAHRDWLAAANLEGDPYTRAAMRRSAGLDSTGTATASTVGQPTTATTIAPPPPPGTQPGVPQPSTPATAFPNAASQPAASPMAIDARALASRAISRELDGDRAGALQDLHAAVALEPDTARREAIGRLIRLLDTPR